MSISRGEPRWRLPFPYRRMRELAPNDRAWAQKDPEAFEEAYTLQLEELGARAILERLEALSDGRPTVLLCWKRPGEFCHRRTLAESLRAKLGIEVPELRPGMLPERADTPQPRLFE
ncbi:MAG: DUF488 domain-containing protein [Actinomycetota bacterium]|nr:DUF488 domain-containing protein [Actinomycetota bacterium]